MTASIQLRCFSIFLALLILLAGVAPSQTVNLFVSSAAGDRISAKPDRQFSDGQNTGTPTFEVNDAINYQTIDGFGASLLEAGLVVLNALPPDQQERVLRSLFDLKEGSGFSAMKTEIAATDFQSAGPWYAYDDDPGDMELKNFSIARDLGPNGMATFIKRARKYGNFVLQAPMDYPPDWMLFDVKKKQDVDPK
jgi:glucosylceramidase